MKYYLIAGEASGDLHGANLMKALKKEDVHARFRFFGGDRMQQVENNLAGHYRDLAFMGAIDVVKNLHSLNRHLSLCKKDIREFAPDVVILIDYPAFNLKIAAFAKKQNIRVFYYISPKIWAWKEWRIRKIKARVDEMFTIFPFEVDFYARHNYPVHYVGNPLLDEMQVFASERGTEALRELFVPDNRPLVALLPGSRKQEIKLMLPVMIQLVDFFPAYRFVISRTVSVEESFYRLFIREKDIPLITGNTYALLAHAHAAVVTSGTATLETALFNVPQIVLYKMIGGALAYKIFQWLFLKVDYISLPNLICGEPVVREFVMNEMKFSLIKPEVEKLLDDAEYREKIFHGYTRLKKILGGPGASQHAAVQMVELLKAGSSEKS
jgi:lipid-A-disaccharide synthase